MFFVNHLAAFVGDMVSVFILHVIESTPEKQ